MNSMRFWNQHPEAGRSFPKKRIFSSRGIRFASCFSADMEGYSGAKVGSQSVRLPSPLKEAWSNPERMLCRSNSSPSTMRMRWLATARTGDGTICANLRASRESSSSDPSWLSAESFCQISCHCLMCSSRSAIVFCVPLQELQLLGPESRPHCKNSCAQFWRLVVTSALDFLLPYNSKTSPEDSTCLLAGAYQASSKHNYQALYLFDIFVMMPSTFVKNPHRAEIPFSRDELSCIRLKIRNAKFIKQKVFCFKVETLNEKVIKPKAFCFTLDAHDEKVIKLMEFCCRSETLNENVIMLIALCCRSESLNENVIKLMAFCFRSETLSDKVIQCVWPDKSGLFENRDHR